VGTATNRPVLQALKHRHLRIQLIHLRKGLRFDAAVLGLLTLGKVVQQAQLRSSLRQEMLNLQNYFAGATILVTHDPAEAALLADEILGRRTGRSD
jgi:hypothetical protein